MAMRVPFRVSQLGGDSILEPLGDEMLKPLCLFVYLIPVVIKNVVQKGFDQSVMPYDL